MDAVHPGKSSLHQSGDCGRHPHGDRTWLERERGERWVKAGWVAGRDGEIGEIAVDKGTRKGEKTGLWRVPAFAPSFREMERGERRRKGIYRQREGSKRTKFTYYSRSDIGYV